MEYKVIDEEKSKKYFGVILVSKGIAVLVLGIPIPFISIPIAIALFCLGRSLLS